MKGKSFFFAIAAVVGALVLDVGGCARHDDVEIPITTSSAEALQMFRDARVSWEELRIDEARDRLQKVVAADSTFAVAYLYLALTQYEPDEFLKYIRKAVALSDRITEGERLLLLAAEANYIHQDRRLATEYALKLVAAYPRDKRAHDWSGFWFWRAREIERAIEQFKKAVEIDARFAPPYNMMGYCYSDLGNFDEAEKHLKTYADLLPDNPNPHDSYGEILMKQGKFDASIQEYKKALSLDPKFSMAFIGLGTTLVLQGKEDEGREQFLRVYNGATDDGQRTSALFSIVDSYIFQNDFSRALQELHKAYELDEKENDTLGMASDLNFMATVLLEIGHLEEAKLRSRSAMELLQHSALASSEWKENAKQDHHRFLVHAALRNGDVEAAQKNAEEYRKLADAGKDARELERTHELAGLIALHEKRFDDAIRELLQADLRNPKTLCSVAEAYEAKGERDKAKEFWTKTANFNEINADYAFVRKRALAKLAEM